MAFRKFTAELLLKPIGNFTWKIPMSTARRTKIIGLSTSQITAEAIASQANRDGIIEI